MSTVTVELDLECESHRHIMREFIMDAEFRSRMRTTEVDVKKANVEFVEHVMGTKAGRLLLTAAMEFLPGADFGKGDLAKTLDCSEETIASWIRVIGRSEQKFGKQLFERGRFGMMEMRYFLPIHIREIVADILQPEV